MFNNLTTDNLEQAQDTLGGYQVLESDIYTGKIKLAYGIKSKNGASGVVLHVDINGTEYRETLYVTNRKGENFYLNKQDPTKKMPLPGFSTVDQMCLVTVGTPLAQQNVEEKTVMIYDADASKELPTNVPVLVDLLGQTVSLAIQKTLEDRTKLVGSEYAPTGETRDANNIAAVFHTETKKTVNEAVKQVENAQFWDKWLAANQGKTRDRTSKGVKSGAPAGKATPPKSGDTTAAPTKSLFS